MVCYLQTVGVVIVLMMAAAARRDLNVSVLRLTS